MAFDFSMFKMAPREKPANSAKMNNFIQATEDAVNDLPISSLSGYPSSASYYPDGSGNWSIPSAAGAPVGGWSDPDQSWTYSSADDKTFVLNVPSDATTIYQPGQRLRLKQLSESTYRYFLVTAVTATKLTVWGGTDYTIDNSTISDNFYSSDRFPLGFPSDPSKWTVKVTDSDQREQHHPDRGTWYNLADISIDVPIGSWHLDWSAHLETEDTDNQMNALATLSTGADSETDTEFTCILHVDITSASTGGKIGTTLGRRKDLKIDAKTTYYLNAKSTGPAIQYVRFVGDQTPTILRALSAYL